jgi:hypothetical protein
LEEIKRKLSSLRRKGIDTRTVDYKIMNIPSKIKLAGITQSERDILKIRSLYTNVISDLEVLEQEYLEEQKKLDRMQSLLQKAMEFLKNGQLKECLPLYYEIRNFYKILSMDSKYKMIDKCIHFYTEFQALVK